jgi:hypothetical protein
LGIKPFMEKGKQYGTEYPLQNLSGRTGDAEAVV